MRTTISLEGILSFIHSLSLSASNKRWLAEKLLEEAQTDQAMEKERLSYAAFIEEMCGAWDDPRPAKEIAAEIRRMHQFGVTRQIMALGNDDEK